MHGNKSLGLLETLFSFRGRIGRLAFVGYSLMTGFVLLILSLTTAAMIVQQGSLAMISLCLYMPWLLSFWVGAALLSRRLHDIGYSALHGVWITALWYGWPWLPEPFATCFALIAVVLGMALIVVPGSGGPNRYGHKAGMAAMRNSMSALRTNVLKAAQRMNEPSQVEIFSRSRLSS